MCTTVVPSGLEIDGFPSKYWCQNTEFLLDDPKIDRFENNSLKNDGFNGTDQTHTNDTLEPTMQ